jgi:hypothetical protein
MSETLIASGSFNTVYTFYPDIFDNGSVDLHEEYVSDYVEFNLDSGIYVNIDVSLPSGDTNPHFDSYCGTESDDENGFTLRCYKSATANSIRVDGQWYSRGSESLNANFKYRIYQDKSQIYIDDELVGTVIGHHNIKDYPFIYVSAVVHASVQVPLGGANPLSSGSANISVYRTSYYSDGSEYSTNFWTDFVNCGERA